EDTALAGAAGAKWPREIYPVQVDPDQLDPAVPKQMQMRASFEAISTSWTISPEQFKLIRDAAHRLLYQHPCFVKLVEEFSSESLETLAQGIQSDPRASCHSDATRP